MKDDIFTFTVQGPEDLNGAIAYRIGDDGAVRYETAQGGKFKLAGVKDGQTVTVLTALPTGEYKVTEEAAKENTFQYDPQLPAADTLEKDSCVSFTVTNNLKENTSGFEVTKEWQQPNGK